MTAFLQLVLLPAFRVSQWEANYTCVLAEQGFVFHLKIS